MRGDELARKVKVLRPDVRVLLTSGYADMPADVEPGDTSLLRKPYSRDELAAAIRASLD
jgi:FixJ family two-component response regulator